MESFSSEKTRDASQNDRASPKLEMAQFWNSRFFLRFVLPHCLTQLGCPWVTDGEMCTSINVSV